MPTVSGPPIRVALTGPPSESRFAPAVPETVTGPPWLATVTVTPGGAVTAKPTEQPEDAHAGAARVSRPPDTDCVTAGGPPSWWSYHSVSVTCTRLVELVVTRTGPP